MVGMIQILTYLLCLYLVYKGVEILMIAYVSTNTEKRDGAVRVGIIMLIVAILAAIGFVLWADSQAVSISDSMQKALPR